MEVKETAAHGISQREFAIEFDDNELAGFFRVSLYAHKAPGFHDRDCSCYSLKPANEH